jgi:hypothetical protein
MSAPPLPDAFGNYALGDFVEVVSPAAISWMPQTAGWAWLAALLLLACLYRGWQWLKHWHHNRYRREARARLQGLSSQGQGEQLVAEVNKLLKLAAMAAYSRERVAGLYGDPWSDFLNRQCAVAPFNAEQTELLAHGAYRSPSLDDSRARALVQASLTWVSEHRETPDV